MEVKEDGGVILVHSEGSFQEGFKGGSLEVETPELTRISFSMLTELAKTFPYWAMQESRLRVFFFYPQMFASY